MSDNAAQRRRCFAEQIVRAVAVGFVDSGERGAGRDAQAAARGDAFLIGEQLLDLRRRRHFGFELAQLIAQQVQPRIAVFRRAFQRLEFAAAGAVAFEQLPRRCSSRRGVAQAFIEQLALRGAAHQMLEFLLAVDFDQDTPPVPAKLAAAPPGR